VGKAALLNDFIHNTQLFATKFEGLDGESLDGASGYVKPLYYKPSNKKSMLGSLVSGSREQLTKYGFGKSKSSGSGSSSGDEFVEFEHTYVSSDGASDRRNTHGGNVHSSKRASSGNKTKQARPDSSDIRNSELFRDNRHTIFLKNSALGENPGLSREIQIKSLTQSRAKKLSTKIRPVSVAIKDFSGVEKDDRISTFVNNMPGNQGVNLAQISIFRESQLIRNKGLSSDSSSDSSSRSGSPTESPENSPRYAADIIAQKSVDKSNPLSKRRSSSVNQVTNSRYRSLTKPLAKPLEGLNPNPGSRANSPQNVRHNP